MIALLVLSHGQLRDGMIALLGAMPEVGLVAQTENTGEALTFLSQQCADLVLVKFDASDGLLLECVRQMKRHCPDIRVVAFFESEKDLPVAEAHEIDLVLLEGVPAPVVAAKIRELVGSLS